MADVTLTASMRANLLTLQNTQTLFDKTSERLATGKEVNSVLDDAVKFFTADALNQRASLLEERKADIGNAVQSVTAATNGITAIKTSIQQLKSLVSQARSALNSASGATTRESIAEQYNEVLKQIDYLAQDASYNGINFLQKDALTNAVTELTTFFNEDSSTSLTITGFDGTAQGLSLTKGGEPTITAAASGADQTVSFGGTNLVTKELLGGSVVTLGGVTVDQAADGSLSITAIDGSVTNVAAGEALAASTFTGSDGVVGVSMTAAGLLTVNYSDDGAAPNAQGEISYVATWVTGGDTTATLTVEGGAEADDVYTFDAANASAVGFTNADGIIQSAFFATSDYVATDFDTTGELNALDTGLNAALATLQSESSKLSGNVGILQTRDNFLKELSNTLTTGADKLTLADINEEGANLLALQTQQQLGITSLSLASQAQQGVLRLF
jgi:flagellin-like hook-associated protein FlgL